MKTLIVEDDFTSRLFLQTVLARYGECHIAVSGMEALEAFRIATDHESPYDLICMDIMMPEMDGKEAVKQVRAMEEARGISSINGAKIIMTTHSLGQARRLGDEILFLSEGRLVERAPVDEFFRQPRSSEAASFLRGELP